MSALAIKGSVWEQAEFDIRALVTDKDGFALTNPVTTGYQMKVYDVSNGQQEVHSVAPSTSLAGILFDVPITVGWDVNDTGYNFSLPVNPADWAIPMVGGHSYRFEIHLDTAALAGLVPVVAVIDVLAMESV